ncbi:MAG TPA: TerB family tellurite resistance protein [Luteimonas sp.]|nr:TerB family tellurite resistance protein [Luteimonas sp.]
MDEVGDKAKFEGVRGALRDIRLLLTDVVGGGRPDADQQLLIEVFFGMMGYVAKADRLVTSHESDVANLIMDEADLSLAARAIAMEAFERGMRRQIDAAALLQRFTAAHPSGSEENDRLHNILLRLAAADGKLDRREYDAMAEITRLLGQPAEVLDARLALHRITVKR